METRPTQYTGAEIASSAPPMARRSMIVPRLIAEMMPIGMPTSSHTTAPPTASEIVAGKRSKMVSRTATLFW
jgi:hypothetical protein